MKKITLNNNLEIPLLGLGTYKLNSYDEVLNSLKIAYNQGVTLIDTAEMYGNEAEIGKAIKEIGITRNELFITTKIWNADSGYDVTMRTFEKSLKNLQTEYIDLYLIHWPRGYDFVDTWKAMENLYKQGVIKSIGVSNFYISHLNELLDKCEIVPAVNQIELHPYLQQQQLVDFCNKHTIAVEAWSPLAKGSVASDDVLNEIGKKYSKNAVQVTLRWLIQNNIIAIPKSSKSDRIKEFAEIFDFNLSDEDMQKISSLDIHNRIDLNLG